MDQYLVGRDALGIITPSQTLPSKATISSLCLNTFTNCDFCLTITIKGARRLRQLEYNFQKQYFIFEEIKNIISSYCTYYYIGYESHKSGDFLHSHAIIRPTKLTNIYKMRQQIYLYITNHKLKQKSYKHRILIEKCTSCCHWIGYILKQFDEQSEFKIAPHYKLKSLAYKCPPEEITKDLIKNLNPTINGPHHVRN